jgi:hypothetical protein
MLTSIYQELSPLNSRLHGKFMTVSNTINLHTVGTACYHVIDNVAPTGGNIQKWEKI